MTKINKKFILAALLCLLLPIFSFQTGHVSAYSLPESFTGLVKTDSGGLYGVKYNKYNAASGATKQNIFMAIVPAENTQIRAVAWAIRSGGKHRFATVAEIAADYEAKTGDEVIMAVNASFFYMDSRADTSVAYASDGVVYTTSTEALGKKAVGWNDDGEYTYGALEDVQATFGFTNNNGDESFDIVSAARIGEGQVAYFDSPGTNAVQSSIRIKFLCDKTDLKKIVLSNPILMNSKPNSLSFEVEAGYAVVAVKEADVEKVLSGSEFLKYDRPMGVFEGMKYVVGGGDEYLIIDGEKGEIRENEPRNFIRHPRTSFGFMDTGSPFVITADGRRADAAGYTIPEEQELCKELQPNFVIEMDGGGSTTFMFREDGELKVLNEPSDATGVRSVINAIMFVRTPIVTQAIELTETNLTLTVGEQKQLTANVTPNNAQEELMFFSSDENVATVSESGLVRAISMGNATITATSGGFSATVSVTVHLGVDSKIDDNTTQRGCNSSINAVGSGIILLVCCALIVLLSKRKNCKDGY